MSVQVWDSRRFAEREGIRCGFSFETTKRLPVTTVTVLTLDSRSASSRAKEPSLAVALELKVQQQRNKRCVLSRVDPPSRGQCNARILVVDNDQVVLHLNSVILRQKGHEVVVCHDAIEAAAIVKAKEIEVLVFAVRYGNSARTAESG